MWPSSSASGHVCIQRMETRVLRCLHTQVPSSVIHNSQNVDTTRASVSGRLDGRGMVRPCHGMLFSPQNKIPTQATTWMNLRTSWKVK